MITFSNLRQWALSVCIAASALGYTNSVTAKNATEADNIYSELPFQMNKVQLPVFPDYSRSITEFGAVADGITLNTEAFDKAIKAVAEKTGFDPKFIEERGEYAPGRTIFSMLPVFDGTQGALSAADFLWAMQRQVILDLADKGPCVILGRCADYILKDRSDVLNVFIYADKAYRAERIVRLYGQSDKKPEDRLEDKDKRRSVNYKHYTGQNWGEMRNYDLCLNSAVFSEDTCTQLIAELAEKR